MDLFTLDINSSYYVNTELFSFCIYKGLKMTTTRTWDGPIAGNILSSENYTPHSPIKHGDTLVIQSGGVLANHQNLDPYNVYLGSFSETLPASLYIGNSTATINLGLPFTFMPRDFAVVAPRYADIEVSGTTDLTLVDQGRNASENLSIQIAPLSTLHLHETLVDHATVLIRGPGYFANVSTSLYNSSETIQAQVVGKGQ